MSDDKEIRWVGSSYDDLLAFPKAPRKEAGFQLGKVRAGLDPTDWKPFDDVGPGTREIRLRDASGIYRLRSAACDGGLSVAKDAGAVPLQRVVSRHLLARRHAQ